MKASLYFEPRDLWIGVYWDRRLDDRDGFTSPERLRVYICLLPTIVLRLVF